VKGRSLETMALAGTVECGEIDRFESDPKEINEHELVAEYLCRKLDTIGTVKREPRYVLRLGPIAHLLSMIHVGLTEELELNELIRFLHPTPALGALPRNEHTLARLHAFREELETPGWFGAPFGAWMDGEFLAVVAIRNIIWSGKRAYLAAGCGLIEASQLESEWKELGLKRLAVKRMLGL
jgi:menaquinone-specific isochorismate synthase